MLASFLPGPCHYLGFTGQLFPESSCGICSGKYDNETNLSLSCSFLPYHLSRYNCYITNYISSGVWIIDPLETRSYWNIVFNHVNITLITLDTLSSNRWSDYNTGINEIRNTSRVHAKLWLYYINRMGTHHANIPFSRFGFKIISLPTVAFLYKAKQCMLTASNGIPFIHSTEVPDVSVLESNWKFRIVCFTFHGQLYAYVTFGDRT